MTMNAEKDLLPWYLNQTLSPEEEQSVEAWLGRAPEAEAYQLVNQQVASALESQVAKIPSPEIRTQLFSRIHGTNQANNQIISWAVALPMTLLMIVLLWVTNQSGNQVKWSVAENGVKAFRIYRAPVGSGTFELVEELPSSPGQEGYQYLDAHLVPWLSYQYIIEMVDQTGKTFLSQSIVSNSQVVFFSQIALLMTGFILTFGVITILEEMRYRPGRERFLD